MTPLNESICHDLIEAASNGDFDGVERALQMGADVNYRSRYGGPTSLHLAVEARSAAIVIRLLEAGADPNLQFACQTALSVAVHEFADVHAAAPEGDRGDEDLMYRIVDLLLAGGADPTAGGPDQEPLGLARLYRLSELERRLDQQTTRS